MNECAQLIERAMKYIVVEIESYESNSVNKEEQIRKIEYLFKRELNAEIYRLRNDRNCKS